MSIFTGAMHSVRRRFRGAPNNTGNTLATTFEYRVTLQLGDPDLIFTNASGTPAGRMERLQVLGLLPRPLSDAPEAQAAYQYVWNTYFPALFAGAVGPALTPDARLNDEIRKYLVGNGDLPEKGRFAKIRVPGDYPVIHRDFDPKYLSEPQFTLAKGSRFDVEQRFWDANPAMGKIPIVAQVEYRPKGGGNNAWVPAKNMYVYFKLEAPDKLPGFESGQKQPEIVAGAFSYVKGAGAPKLRNKLGAKLRNVRTPTNGEPGPRGYLDRHVYKRQLWDPAITAPIDGDPQLGNAHWEFGGKAQLVSNGRNVYDPLVVGPVTHQNVFVLNNVGRFYTTYSAAEEVPGSDHTPGTHMVRALTDGNGRAGVIFNPSRVGGDRYKLGALVNKPGKHAKTTTGTMVRWRTIRISRRVEVRPPTIPAGMSTTIANQFSRFDADCGHAASRGGRWCTDCHLREADVAEIDYPGYLSSELAKSYCELLVTQTPPESAHDVITAPKLAQIVDDFMTDQEDGKIDAGIVETSEAIGLTDGVAATYTTRLSGKGTILKKNVKVKVGEETVAIDDGAGNLIETGSIAQMMRCGTNINGTIDYATGDLTITFASAPPPKKLIKCGYRVYVSLDWRTLVYHDKKSPYLINLHAPEVYNTRVDNANYPLLFTTQDVKDHVLTAATDATQQSVTAALPARISNVQLKLDGAPLSDQYVSYINEASGSVKVVAIEKVTEVLAHDPAVDGSNFTHVLANPMELVSGGQLLQIKLRAVGGVAGDTALGFVRGHDLDFYTSSDNTQLQKLQVDYDRAANQVDIDFGVVPPVLTHVIIEYSKPKNLPAAKRLTADFTVERAHNNANPRAVGSGPAAPVNAVRNMASRAINYYLLARYIRAIDDNGGYMPGLLLLRAPLRDTWTAVWDPAGYHEGKGVCNGFLLFYGNRWRKKGYDRTLEANAATTSEPDRFAPLVLHEMSHCVYHNHFASGANVAGPRADQHDSFDACLMGYGSNNSDFCGQCTAAYMGLNYMEPRMITWNGKWQMSKDIDYPDEATEVAGDLSASHVEPPDIAAKADGQTDSDEVYAMLQRCPTAWQIYKDACDAVGHEAGNAYPQPVSSGGLISEISSSLKGTGNFDQIAGTVTYTYTNVIKLALGEVPVAGAIQKTVQNMQVQEVVGADIAVQVLVMELNNCKDRYDFIDCDADRDRGRLGLMAYIRRTEKIEYDGGVQAVIASYNACHATWKARINAKKDAEVAVTFQNYYDTVLPEVHKDKYRGYWYAKGARAWYCTRVPRLNSFGYRRLELLLLKVTAGLFKGFDDRGTSGAPTIDGLGNNFDLYADDDAIWKTMLVLFAGDADWDLDATNATLTWAAGQFAGTAGGLAIPRVQHMRTRAALKWPAAAMPVV